MTFEAGISDADLVARSLAEDRNAFGQIVARYQTLICSLAYSATGSLTQSENLSQETFLAAWKQLPELREPGKLRSWLCGIVRNLSYRALRARLREPVYAAEEMDAAHEAPAVESLPRDQTISREEEAILWRSLEKIPGAYREPLILFYREQQSVERVAQVLDLSEDVVRQRLSRGRKLLQEEVASFVEGALRQSAPGAAFAGTVLAALPSSTAGLAAGIGAAKSGSLFSLLTLPIIGLLASLTGTLGVIRNAKTPHERKFRKRMVTAIWIDSIGLAVALIVSQFLRVQYGWRDNIFVTVQVGCYLLWAAFMAPLVLVFVRQSFEIRSNIAHAATPSNAARPKLSVLITACALTAGALASFVHIAWQAGDHLSVAIITATAVSVMAWALCWIYFPRLLLNKIRVSPSRLMWVPTGLTVGATLFMLNWRLDRWIASIRGTDLADAHLFLPMWIVHLSTVLLLVWIAVLVVKTSPKGFYITKMPPLLKSIVPIGILVFAGALTSYAADLSPANWPKAERERLEKLESQTWSPLEERSVEGSAGIISATVSPLSTYAGIQALKQGGNAADAAATTALTQVTMQLGSVVSYAGIFTMLYYDAKAHQVYSMDAGYNSYLQETDPKGIPIDDLGPLPVSSAPKPAAGGAKGRETLVPGFMAGVEAMQSRFGRMAFRDLFEPAVWYAQNGVRISPALQYFFAFRRKFLSRTPEGQQFMRQAGNEAPKAGDLFVQPDLAKTLGAIGEHGSRYMYTGQWGEDFVRIVRREGGKVTAEDLRRYEPIWSKPHTELVFGHTVYVNGSPHTGAYALFAGLNLSEALKLDQRGPYWTDPETFQALVRIGQIVASAPTINKDASDFLLSRGIDISADAQLGKAYAQAIAPLLGKIFAEPADNGPKHSNAIVVIDREGNIAAITHTINAVIWGDTGIVVDGIPIPDSAGFQQLNLATIKPGDRVPHQIIDAIAFEGEIPVLATASIGSSLIPESIRTLVGILGQHQDLSAVMAAPPLLTTTDMSGAAKALSQQAVSIPQGAYGADYVARLRALGLNLTIVPAATAGALRGTLAAVVIDPRTGKRTAVDQPGVMVFNGTE